jgi:uroporphyrinogen III methyltransferase/synthase
MKVLVTRARPEAGRLVSLLEARGLQVEVCPLIRIEPIDGAEIDTTGYDWVIVTSRNGARELARRWTGELRRVAAIGPGTAEELRALGVEPTLVPLVSTQEGLLAQIPQPAGRVLFAGAEDARTLLVERLDADFVRLYRTVPELPATPPDADLAVLASGSAARVFAQLGLRIPAVVMGPQTAAAARQAGVEVIAEAPAQTLESLVDTVVATAAELEAAG